MGLFRIEWALCWRWLLRVYWWPPYLFLAEYIGCNWMWGWCWSLCWSTRWRSISTDRSVCCGRTVSSMGCCCSWAYDAAGWAIWDAGRYDWWCCILCRCIWGCYSSPNLQIDIFSYFDGDVRRRSISLLTFWTHRCGCSSGYKSSYLWFWAGWSHSSVCSAYPSSISLCLVIGVLDSTSWSAASLIAAWWGLLIATNSASWAMAHRIWFEWECSGWVGDIRWAGGSSCSSVCLHRWFCVLIGIVDVIYNGGCDGVQISWFD